MKIGLMQLLKLRLHSGLKLRLEAKIMTKYSKSTLMRMSKKDLIREVLIAQSNQKAAETAMRKQAANVMDWEPVRHGRWEHECDDCWYCSSCGIVWQTLNGASPKENDMKFCPCCGAKMDEGVEANG